MNLTITRDNLKAALVRQGVFDGYTYDGADWIFNFYVDDEDGDYDFEDLCDLIRFNAHVYWPGQDEDYLDVYDFYDDYIEPEGYYTLEEFLKIVDRNNHLDNDRYWIEENLEAYIMKDGSIIKFE